ncbi:glycoside hydrolase family 88/105 protein [Paenibacillus whitsoniae]|uniref:Glycosyl hydrolase n=1 Tax=Paenibacillus whitsoniae TaxID=2496558 RepID=A0A430JJT1_9BACL|nr:glycoside hydrolase family 88 protein [Paenibacillus whitsoniae]RTE11281.1 glycosyl hydrolase [Paenibacillus whitsoniae]
MTYYFDAQESAYAQFGDDEGAVLGLLADRYKGANPPVPFIFRVSYPSGVRQTREGLYELDLQAKFPDARPGHFAYAYALVWSDSERNLDLLLESLGPVQAYLNEERIFRSNVIEEILPDARVKLNVTFAKGWNRLFVKMTSTPAGFGCRLGADEAKVRILNVLTPFPSRAGQSGWVYSEPVEKDLFPDGPDVHRLAAEECSGLRWLPAQQWDEAQRRLPNFARMFGGGRPGQLAYAWTKLELERLGGAPVVLEGQASGPITVWVNGTAVLEQPHAGSFRKELALGGGSCDVLVRSVCTDAAWGFTLGASCAGASCRFALPVPVKGTDQAWMFVGPLDPDTDLPLSDFMRTDRVYPSGSASGHQGADSSVYWRLDAPDAAIRPIYENAMLSNKWTVGTVTNYARWDYPLGVTIYGLLQAGRWLNRPDLTAYAVAHVQACTRMYDYALWDREQYGFPAVNQQLVLMKMLDNCGSFGSAMLEAYSVCGDEAFLRIAERIADFMLNRLERREDGAFFRECPGEYSANTMWADDLYMSTPFLCRYYKLTGSERALDEAANQFLLFRNYLYIPEHQIMSHVFDFKYGRATGIPWGRGNGWTLFSLTEVLETLPGTHSARPALLAFFNELCSGYAALQAESGLWRQVLNDPDAYEEASCTAMFAYAFARGVRFGWLNDPERFLTAASNAWRGLTQVAIDRQGNVHGVCSGSRYAFHAEYYKDDLKTVLNDNHGIGIMMLAGTEVAKLNARWTASVKKVLL